MYNELVLRGLTKLAALDKSLHCTFEQPTTERRHACHSTRAAVTACQWVSTEHGTRHHRYASLRRSRTASTHVLVH